MTDKEKIIELFHNNVKGKKADVSHSNQKHDGKTGHWLEQQFNISANANNGADLWGYELKNETSSKTTFGDWSANQYIHKAGKYPSVFVGKNIPENQDIFCGIFGKANESKNGRCSWSGSPCPKIDGYSVCGQIFQFEPNGDLIALYSFSEDQRTDKANIVPAVLQQESLEIARWYGKESPSKKAGDKCLKDKLEDKFNHEGWFTCKTDSTGVYNEICFGGPICYDTWIELVKQGVVFFDSGMYQGNKRPYSQWRADNRFWDSMIIERYS